MSRTWPVRFYCLSNLKYIKVTKNFYSQSFGNLEVIGVQKTACFAHMTSRSYIPEFYNPLEKAVDTFQRYNTVAVSMHKIGHFTSNSLAYSRIHVAYSTLLFTGCVWHLSGENVGVTIGHSRKDPYPCLHRQRKFPPSREGERQNVLRCLGGCGSKFVQGVTLCKSQREIYQMFVNFIQLSKNYVCPRGRDHLKPRCPGRYFVG